MRLYIRDSQRKPDPELKPVNAHLAVYVGIGAWVVGLVALFTSQPAKPFLWFTCCIVGILLGVVMLGYLGRKH